MQTNAYQTCAARGEWVGAEELHPRCQEATIGRF